MTRLDRDFKLLAVANVLYSTGLGLYQQLLFVYALQLGASRFTIGLLNALMLATIMLVNIPGAWAATRFRLKPVLVATWWLLVPTSLAFYFAPTWQWLIPGLILFGLAYANMPVFKAYVYLKSESGTVGTSMAFVFGSYSLGLVAAPLVGGWIAEEAGMRTVFLVSTVAYILSATVVCFLRDTPNHPPRVQWRVHHLFRGATFRGHLAFFLAGFLAVYVAQPFVNPYLAQVHDQSYAALGVFSSLVALGGVLSMQLVGRLTDRWGAQGRGRHRHRPAPARRLAAHHRHRPRPVGRRHALLRRVRHPAADALDDPAALVRPRAAAVGLRRVRHGHGRAHGVRRGPRRAAVRRLLRAPVPGRHRDLRRSPHPRPVPGAGRRPGRRGRSERPERPASASPDSGRRPAPLRRRSGAAAP